MLVHGTSPAAAGWSVSIACSFSPLLACVGPTPLRNRQLLYPVPNVAYGPARRTHDSQFKYTSRAFGTHRITAGSMLVVPALSMFAVLCLGHVFLPEYVTYRGMPAQSYVIGVSFISEHVLLLDELLRHQVLTMTIFI